MSWSWGEMHMPTVILIIIGLKLITLVGWKFLPCDISLDNSWNRYDDNVTTRQWLINNLKEKVVYPLFNVTSHFIHQFIV